MTIKLRTQLILLNTAVIGTASVLLVVILYFMVTRQMLMESRAFLQDEFHEYRLLYQTRLDDVEILTRDMEDHFTKARMSFPIFCRVYDSQGNIPVELSITEIVEDLSELWHEIGRERNVTLRVDMPEGIRLTGHPALLRRLLSNLTENAFKHTPAGGIITVGARSNNGQATLTVKDSGHGIEASELPKLFNRFYRTSTAYSERISGTGLGLNICQKIVMLHGGRIDVESRTGEGTTLRITLPLRQPGGPNQRST